MADTKISALPSATTPLTGTEVLPLVQIGGNVKVAVSDLTAGRAVSALSFAGPLNGTVGATTPAAGAFTTLSATGDTSLATTPVLYGGDGAVSSGRLIGRYSYRTATPTTAYFYDFNNSNTITSADSLSATKLATLINSTVTNANALTAYGTSYGAKAAGLSFISGTASDILLASVASPPLLNADINAVVVGYTSVGPRIAIQNYALNDDTANAINYVGAVHRFYPAGSAVATIDSAGLAVTGALSATGNISKIGTAATGVQSFRSYGTTTSYNYIQIDNTGGTLNLGVNGSVGGEIATGTSAYATVFGSYTNTPVEVIVNSAKVASFASTGLAVTGTLSATGAVTLSGGTANGVAYLDGSKVLTTGTAFTFDGANVLTLFRTTGTEANEPTIKFSNLTFAGQNPGVVKSSNGGLALDIQSPSDSTFPQRSRIYMNGGSNDSIIFQTSSNNGSTYGDRMVLTSTGLGIGTSSPAAKLDVNGGALIQGLTVGLGAGAVSTNTVVGSGALATNSTGTGLTAVGYQTLNVSTADYNTAVGWSAGFRNSSGTKNTFLGVASGYNVTTGQSNTFVGYTSGPNAALSTGSYNTAVGESSLFSNTTASNNTAVGYQAGYAVNGAGGITAVGTSAIGAGNSAYNTTAIGYVALNNNGSTGYSNTAVGAYAMMTNTSGRDNVAIGSDIAGVVAEAALFTNTSGSKNVAIGNASLGLNTTGGNNVALGYMASYSNDTASNNTAVGYQAGYTNVTGTENFFGGYLAGQPATGSYLTFVGSRAGNAVITGSSNTAVGYYAYGSGSSGQYNTAIGQQALYLNTTASNNTAVGYQAGYNKTGTGDDNTFIGRQAGYFVTSGTLNTFVGAASGPNATAGATGSSNTAIGYAAGSAITSGSNNTAVGQQALSFNTTASNNTAVGYQAGYTNTTGYGNTLLGHSAGYNLTTGYGNVLIGSQVAAITNGTGYALTTGALNTFVGAGSGTVITTGSKNTILGRFEGNAGGIDIRTASNYIVLSDGDGNPLISTANSQTVALKGAVPNSGTGITFPATQSASTDANTLDDYEEGTWSAGAITTVNVTGASFSEGRYTKIGNIVHIQGKFSLTVTTANTLTYVVMNLPFTPLFTMSGSLMDNVSLVAGTAQAAINGSAYAFFAASALLPAGATDWFVSYEYQV